ncbi:hypothetical protein IFM89_023968 [Coptis chinensis]|uniref:Endonuclease/exonuclease/phosphatase domain-containing protein n=1 Tax=Coptis chinensis TaxID=261450 RepID=A0A835HLY1_9MAGN|nr:hypothetical protein IFM89_023968 [Coptis chinensis]
MSIISWNCRGVGRLSMVSALKDHIRKERPILIFLSETLASYNKSVGVIRSLGGDYRYFVIPAVGHSGGLWLLWDSNLKVNILYSDSWIIHAELNGVSGLEWYFSGVYASTKMRIRRTQWSILNQLQPNAQKPWVCLGDFNSIMCHEERWGGRPAKKSHIDAFQEMVYNCGLLDVGYVGNIFTWCNGQEGLSRMYQRLDRVLCNPFWRTSFAEAQVIHISTIHSDHKILLVQLHPKKSKLKRPFRFESMWTTDPTCKEVIKAAMQIEFDGSSSYAFCRNRCFVERNYSNGIKKSLATYKPK